MNRVRLNIFCLDITLQKSQKLVRHCFVRKPRVRRILHQRVCFVTSSNQPRSHELQKYTESDSPCLSSYNESEQSFNLDDVAVACINRMAFCMRMRCWCGGNVQGVCPSIILALLISLFFAIFHMEAPENTQEFFSIAFL